MPGPTQCFFGPTFRSRGFDFVFQPGVQPSVCMLYTVPHVPSLPNVAELRFQTDGESPFIFRDCLLEEPRLIVGQQGQYWQLPIKDRRWKWQWGRIYGSYNIRKPNGSYIREKTPQELAALCLDAMDETGYDVGRLPNDPRPLMQWEDGAHPATELDQLCQSMGCIVVLNPLTDKVEIWPLGVGNALPNGPKAGASYAPIIPAEPSTIIVEAGPTLFQATFRTEAVGLDVDGKWKAIDSLSYKPAHGWNKCAAFAQFPDVTGSTFNASGRLVKHRDLAKATVFRCYRISGLSHGGWAVPGITNAPQSRKDFKFFSHLADEEVAPDDGGLRPLQPNLYVKAFRADHPFSIGEERYSEGFRFDTDAGIIEVNEMLILADANGGLAPGDVRIECSFYAGRDGVYDREGVTHNFNHGIDSPPRLISRPEIQKRVVMRYSDNNTFTVDSTATDTYQRLFYWRDAALSEYGLRNGGTIQYEKLIPLSPDGLTLQITWAGGGGRTPTTVASQAQRHNKFVPQLDEYRDRLALRKDKKSLHQLVASFTHGRSATPKV
jgi:hypothetical protein